MDLVSLVVRLHLAPIRGLIAVAELIRDETERERSDPSRMRQEIEETEAAVEAGEISEEEADREHEETLEPHIVRPDPEGAAADGAADADTTDTER